VAARRDESSPWRVAVVAVLVVGVLWAALWGAIQVSDEGRVPSELAAAAQQPGDMVCSGGSIIRGDGSFLASFFSSGHFRCAAWRMRRPRVDTATGTTDWPTSPRR
jgi:drug/metabolite transporter (DMT)-like permease